MLASNRSPEYTWSISEIVSFFQRRPEWVQSALNDALAADAEARWAWVVDLYLDQRISLGKAADLLGVHALELREQFQQLGIPLRLGPADLTEAQAEVDSVRRWFTPTSTDEPA